jgi:hypothetical protein
MHYFSEFYRVEVRDEIAKEFTNSRGEIDDMMAGLHEIRLRRAEQEHDFEALAKKRELFFYSSFTPRSWWFRKLSSFR